MSGNGIGDATGNFSQGDCDKGTAHGKGSGTTDETPGIMDAQTEKGTAHGKGSGTIDYEETFKRMFLANVAASSSWHDGPVKTEGREKTPVESHLADEFRAIGSSEGIDVDTLVMAAKRARTRGPNDDKVTIMETLARDVNRLIGDIGDLSQFPLMAQIVHDANAFTQAATATENLAKQMLARMDKKTLQKLMLALENKNGDLKMTSISSCIFAAHMQHSREIEAKVKTMNMLMLTATVLSVTNTFADVKGDIQWQALKEFILETVSS